MAMIPYVELVSGLTSWRTRQGLATGASDYLGEAPRHEIGVATSAPPVAAYGYDEAPAAEYVEDFSDMDIVSEEDAAAGLEYDSQPYAATPDATDMVALDEDDAPLMAEPAYGGYGDDPQDAAPIYDDSDAHRAATVDSASFEDPAYDAESQPYASAYSEEADEATVIGESPERASVADDEFAPVSYDDDIGAGFDAAPLAASEETLDVDAGEIEEEYAMDDGGATMIHAEDGSAPPPLEPPPLADPFGAPIDPSDDDPFA